MKQRFNINYYRHSEIPVCMLCETKEDSDNFRVYLNRIGLEWFDGGNYIENDYWSDYRNCGICYFFYKGTYGYENSDYILGLDKICLFYSDFDWGDKKSCKFMEKKNA